MSIIFSHLSTKINLFLYFPLDKNDLLQQEFSQLTRRINGFQSVNKIELILIIEINLFLFLLSKALFKKRRRIIFIFSILSFPFLSRRLVSE